MARFRIGVIFSRLACGYSATGHVDVTGVLANFGLGADGRAKVRQAENTVMGEWFGKTL